MAIQRVAMSAAAAAAVLIGVVGCSVSPQEDSTTITPSKAESAPDRNVTLDVGTIIHPDGTVEYVDRNVTLDVGTVIHADGTTEYRNNEPIDASTLLEASTGQ